MTVKKLKSTKTKPVRFMAGDWEVFLQTVEGNKIPLFKTLQERLYFQKDFEARIVLRRLR